MKDLNELTGAMNDFAASLEQSNQRRAIREAQQRMNQIRDAEASQDEKDAAMRALSQDLAFRMTASNANPVQIEQLQKALSPAPQPVIQTAEQAYIMGNTAQQARGKELIKREQEFKRGLELEKTDRALEVAGVKAAGKAKSDIKASIKDFQKIGKAELDGLDALAATPGEVEGGNLGYVMNLKGLIKRSDPRISDADYKTAIPNTSLMQRVNRVYDALINNQPLPEDKEAVIKMTEALKTRTERRLQQKIDGYSRAQSRYLEAGPDELRTALTEQYMAGSSLTPVQPAQQQAPMQQQPSQAQGVGAQMQQTAGQPQTPSQVTGPSKYFK